MMADNNFGSAISAATDLIVLPVGFILDIAIFIVILSKQRLRNPIGCYVMSMTITSFLMLFIDIGDVLVRWSLIQYDPDYYYYFSLIMEIILHSSSLTVAALTLDRFIFFCRIDSKWRVTIAKIMTAVKVIVSIWCHTAILTAMDTKLYEYLANSRSNSGKDIFFWLSGVYVVFPTVIIFSCDFMLGLKLFKFRKVIITKWSPQDLESLRLLMGLTLVLYFTIIPYWIVAMMISKYPMICCSQLIVDIAYYFLKLYSITVPISCIVTCQNLRRSLLEIVLRCRGR